MMLRFIPRLALAAVLPCIALAHGRVLVEPVWCAEQTMAEPSTTPIPGVFPGPSAHFKMTNIELGGFDLGREIPALVGRNVRVRFWLMEPNGMIAEHCHSDRPAFVYLLQGTVIETIEIDGKPVKRTLKAGQSVPERNGTRHWWLNASDENVLMVAVDIPNVGRLRAPAPPSVMSHLVEVKDLEELQLKDQYPHIPEVDHYRVKGRLISVSAGGRVGLEYHDSRPGIVYIIEGTLLEHRSDHPAPLVRRSGDVSMTNNGIWNYWENKGKAPAQLLVVRFEECGACGR